MATNADLSHDTVGDMQAFLTARQNFDYLIEIQRHQQQNEDVWYGHAAQVQVGGASHLWASPHHQNGQGVSQQAEQQQRHTQRG